MVIDIAMAFVIAMLFNMFSFIGNNIKKFVGINLRWNYLCHIHTQ